MPLKALFLVVSILIKNVVPLHLKKRIATAEAI